MPKFLKGPKFSIDLNQKLINGYAFKLKKKCSRDM